MKKKHEFKLFYSKLMECDDCGKKDKLGMIIHSPREKLVIELCKDCIIDHIEKTEKLIKNKKENIEEVVICSLCKKNIDVIHSSTPDGPGFCENCYEKEVDSDNGFNLDCITQRNNEITESKMNENISDELKTAIVNNFLEKEKQKMVNEGATKEEIEFCMKFFKKSTVSISFKD